MYHVLVMRLYLEKKLTSSEGLITVAFLHSRFKIKDIPGNVLKGVPDFCTVYVISKSGKISSTRSAARLAPFIHPLRHQFMQNANTKSNTIEDSNPPPRGIQNTRSKFFNSFHFIEQS